MANIIDDFELQRAKSAATKEKWGEENRERMVRLCQSFPTLRGAPGTAPWDALELLRWLCLSGETTSGSRHAARFVLSVWNSGADWQSIARQPVSEGGLGLSDVELAPFNCVQALAVWDSDHERAFVQWCELPFWP